jgi:hypothetical protein
MATPTKSTDRERARRRADEDASVGELVERAIGGARDLATHEAALALAELEQDAREIRLTIVLGLMGGSCFAVCASWAGVALALALGVGALGLAIGAAILAIGGGLALYGARRSALRTILEKSRARLERRLTRVSESLR